MKPDTKKIATFAMLSAIAYVVVFVGRIPLLSYSFLNLKYDPKDIIIAIGGFIYGPLPAAFMSFVVSFVEMITISADGIIGLAMNVIATCAFACTAAFIYKRWRTLSGAVVGLFAGCLAMTGGMLLWNYILTPLYLGIPRSSVVGLLVPVFLPFNLLKSGINATLTMLLYKPLVRALRRSNLIPEQESPTAGVNYGVIIVSAFILASLVLAFVLSRN